MTDQNNYSQEFISQLNNAPVKKLPLNNKLALAVIFAIGLLILFVSGTLIFDNIGNKDPNLDNLAKHVKALSALSIKYNKDLSSSALRSVNGNLQLVLTNLNREIVDYSKNSTNETISKTPPKVDKSAPIEILKTADQALGNAKLNAGLDRAFVNEVTYLLDQDILMINQLKAQSKSDNLTKVLQKAYDDLTELKTQLTNLNLA